MKYVVFSENLKEAKSMPTNGCKIRLIKILNILKEVSEYG